MTKYYLDTSIWLDLFEKRNEPNLPKGIFAKNLMEFIVSNDGEIIYSDAVEKELTHQGYQWHDLPLLFFGFEKILVHVEATPGQISKARDLSEKRKIPLLDAIHAMVAKDNKALLITRDRHFTLLRDIVESRKPEDVI